MSAIPTGSFAPGLPLEDRARATGDLLAAEDREHHGRIGRSERRAEECRPSASRSRAGNERRASSGRPSRTSRASPSEMIGTADSRKRRQPTRMPPSKRITISARTAIRSTSRIDSASSERRPDVRRDRRGEQEQRRRPARASLSLILFESTATANAPETSEHDRAEVRSPRPSADPSRRLWQTASPCPRP